MRLSRPGKILRNLLLAALLAALTAAAASFPPLTVSQICRQMERDLLLPDLTPVFSTSCPVPMRGHTGKNTFVIARSGDTFAAFQFQRNGLLHSRFWQTIQPQLSNQALLLCPSGTVYIAGDFQDAASAVATVTVQEVTQWRDYTTGAETDLQLGECQELTYHCQRECEQVFSFPCFEPKPDSLQHTLDRCYQSRFVNPPEDDPPAHAGSLLDWALPIDVTLYDADGQELRTLSFSVQTYDFT